MLLYAFMFTLFSLIPFFTSSFNSNETWSISLKKSTHKNYAKSIINGLVHGVGLQYLHQEASFYSFPPRLDRSYSFPLECFYYIEDELSSEKDDVYNFFQGIGAIGTAWYVLVHKWEAVKQTPDRETQMRATIIHACDGHYDEFISKDQLTVGKAICKMLVRSAVASTIFHFHSQKLEMNAFKYRYGLFEALIPLVDLIEKMPAVQGWHTCNKKRFSRLIKSLMRYSVYAMLATEKS